MRAALTTAVLVVMLTAACAAVAPAAQTLRGETAQHKKVVLRVGDDGMVTLFRFDWTARCRARRFDLFDGRTSQRAPIATSTPTEFGETGAYTGRFKNRVRARITMKTNGTRNADGSWSGTFRVKRLVARRNGRVIGRCRTRLLSWSAR